MENQQTVRLSLSGHVWLSACLYFVPAIPVQQGRSKDGCSAGSTRQRLYRGRNPSLALGNALQGETSVSNQQGRWSGAGKRLAASAVLWESRTWLPEALWGLRSMLHLSLNRPRITTQQTPIHQFSVYGVFKEQDYSQVHQTDKQPGAGQLERWLVLLICFNFAQELDERKVFPTNQYQRVKGESLHFNSFMNHLVNC